MAEGKKTLTAVRIRGAENGFVVSCEYSVKNKKGPMAYDCYDSEESVFTDLKAASVHIEKELKSLSDGDE